MNNEVWKKTADFLKELRCEGTGRISYIELPEYNDALKEKIRSQKLAEKTIFKMDYKSKNYIREYIENTEKCAEEENQQAYLQGVIDTLMILSGLGIIKIPMELEEWIKKIK